MALLSYQSQDIFAPANDNGSARSPSLQQMQVWGTEVEAIVSAAATAAAIFDIRGNLDASLAYAANTMAWVVADPVSSYNGIYRKSGASGSGFWTRIADLPYGLIVASNVGAGTSFNLVATSALPISESALVVVNVTTTNTSTPVTISFNDDDPLTVVSVSGANLAVGGLKSGMRLLGVKAGSNFLLLSDQAIASLVYEARDAAEASRVAAEAAEVAAETAKDIAEGYASDAVSQGNVPILSTLLGLSGIEVPTGINFLRMNGYTAAGDSPPIHLKKLGSAPATPKSNQWQSDDGAWWQFTDRQINAEAFGVKADGETDSTAAMANALEIAKDEGKALILPAGNIRASIVLENHPHIHIIGNNRRASTLKPVGSNPDVIRLLGGGVGDFYMESVGVNTVGTSVRPIFFDGLGIGQGNAATIKRCFIRGDLSGPLIYSTAQLINVLECNLQLDNANTIAVLLENFNQNCDLSGNLVGGVGKGFQILQSGGLSRVEGLSISRNKFINTGSYNLDIGNCYVAQIWGNILDQATDYAVRVSDGATFVDISGNWAGLRTSGVGTSILIDNNCGGGIRVRGNFIRGGTTGLAVAAIPTSRVAIVGIQDNVFFDHTNQALILDSVVGCMVTGNYDLNPAPAFGSWVTSGTFGAGEYTFDGNRWAGVTPALIHAGSDYSFGNDRGVVGRYSQTTSPPESAGTATGVNHGINPGLAAALGVKMQVTPRAYVGGCWHTVPDGTGAAIGWEVSGTPTFDVVSWVGR